MSDPTATPSVIVTPPSDSPPPPLVVTTPDGKIRDIIKEVDALAADPGVKAGIRTTEFWLTVAAHVINIVILSGLLPATSEITKALSLGGTILATVIYTLGRSAVKKAAS